MRSKSGFTLIELMVTVAIVAIIAAIAYPSYQSYIVRGARSAGQQFLTDVAQREEQYFLDQRSYFSTIVEGTPSDATQITMHFPEQVSQYYQTPVITVTAAGTGVAPGFVISMSPVSGSILVNDGNLVINNLQQHWRETDGDKLYGANDCRWEDSTCTPH